MTSIQAPERTMEYHTSLLCTERELVPRCILASEYNIVTYVVRRGERDRAECQRRCKAAQVLTTALASALLSGGVSFHETCLHLMGCITRHSFIILALLIKRLSL